ncbi:MAG: iron-siderophore ABC transporter substrate-binding protein, partial [Ilumatobacter sp.]
MKRLVSVALLLAVVAAACGSDGEAMPLSDSASGPDATVSTEISSSGESAGDTPSTLADEDQDDAADGADEVTDETVTASFPTTITHKFGATTIEDEPERVVSVGYNEHDFLLALDVVPVGLRDWYGDQPNSVWPWAQEALGGATPEVLPAGDLNFEQIAALDPDLIVGVWSGMTEADYELLAAIAPTVAQPDTYDDYGTPWQEQTMILGQATGRSEQAAAAVDAVEQQVDAIRAEYPEWEGLSSSVAFVTESGPGAYTSQDTRSRVMVDLGFEIPEINDSGGDNSFFLQLSAEDITPLDVDVLVWVIGSDEALDGILTQLPTRGSLDAYNEGREVFADFLLTGAFSHGSPLSLG